MELIKIPIQGKPNTIKLLIGSEYEAETQEMQGNVELDIESQSHFVDLIISLFEEENISLIVDMKNITYIDSSGLWALFEGHKKATQKESRMLLFNVYKDVKRVLDITKMSSKLNIFDSEEDAIKSLE